MRTLKILSMLAFAASLSYSQKIGAGFSWLSSNNFELDNAKSIKIFSSVPVIGRLELSLSYGYTFNSKSYNGFTWENPWDSYLFPEPIRNKLSASVFEISLLYDLIVLEPFALSLGVAGSTNSLDVDAYGVSSGRRIPMKNVRLWGYGFLFATRYNAFFVPFLSIDLSVQSTSLIESHAVTNITNPFVGQISTALGLMWLILFDSTACLRHLTGR